MAPIRPIKASTASTKSNELSSRIRRSHSIDDPYAIPHSKRKASTKVHKRHVKHATLLSRLQRTATDSRVKKRRRTSQKLATDLAALGDALPESFEPTLESFKGPNGQEKIKYNSSKSRPGAMKRREKLMATERARFEKNLALMAFGPGKTDQGVDEVSLQTREDQNSQNADAPKMMNRTEARWKAIREHISRTMETINQNSVTK